MKFKWIGWGHRSKGRCLASCVTLYGRVGERILQGVLLRLRSLVSSDSNIELNPEMVQAEDEEWIATSHAATKLTR